MLLDQGSGGRIHPILCTVLVLSKVILPVVHRIPFNIGSHGILTTTFISFFIQKSLTCYAPFCRVILNQETTV